MYESVEQILKRLRQAKNKQEVEACLSELWKKTAEINRYYRAKFCLDDPPAKMLEAGRKIIDMQKQGLPGKEICSRLHLSRAMYYHVQAEYRIWQEKAIEGDPEAFEETFNLLEREAKEKEFEDGH